MTKIRGKQVDFNPTYFGITVTTDTVGRWTANINGITEYYDGLTVTLLLSTSYNSTYNTININGIGEKLVWFRKDSRLTSHVGQYSLITLVYNSNAGAYSTFTGGFQMETTYLDGVESYTNRYNYFAPLSGSNGMPAYKLWAFDANGNAQPFTITAGTGTTKTINTCTFRLSSGIFYNGYSGSVAANGRLLAAYQYVSVSIDYLNYTHNGISSPTLYSPIYLKATPGSDIDTFTLNTTNYTSFLTQTLPTTDDGFIYIKLGTLYSSANTMLLESNHPVYYYKDGALRVFSSAYVQGGSGGSQVQSDFNITDTANAGFILNKPIDNRTISSIIDAVINKRLQVNPSSAAGSYNEGIRVANVVSGGSLGYSLLALGCDPTKNSGLNTDGNQWHIIKYPNGDLAIVKNSSDSSQGLYLDFDAGVYWKGNKLQTGSLIRTSFNATNTTYHLIDSYNLIDINSSISNKDFTINLDETQNIQIELSVQMTKQTPSAYSFVFAGANGGNVYFDKVYTDITTVSGDSLVHYVCMYINGNWFVSNQVFEM